MKSNNLQLAIHSLKDYIGKKEAEYIDMVIKCCALGGASSALLSGWLPGAGGAIATGIALGFTLTMYSKICKACGITLKKNILKAIASVAVSEIAAYLGAVIVLETALSLFPGIGSVGAAILSGVLNYAMIYVAGVLFLFTITKVFKAKRDKQGIENMTEEELLAYIRNEATKENIASMYEEAKKSYNTVKNDPFYKTEAENVVPTDTDDNKA